MGEAPNASPHTPHKSRYKTAAPLTRQQQPLSRLTTHATRLRTDNSPKPPRPSHHSHPSRHSLHTRGEMSEPTPAPRSLHTPATLTRKMEKSAHHVAIRTSSLFPLHFCFPAIHPRRLLHFVYSHRQLPRLLLRVRVRRDERDRLARGRFVQHDLVNESAHANFQRNGAWFRDGARGLFERASAGEFNRQGPLCFL